MLFKVQIKNLGKLAEETIHVRPFTVLAGRNNTGKSFFSKSLYSVFNAVNAKHALVVFGDRASPLRDDMDQMTAYAGGYDNGDGDKAPSPLALSLNDLSESVNRMGAAAAVCSLSGGDADIPVPVPMSGKFANLKNAAHDVQSAFDKFKPQAAKWISEHQNASPFIPGEDALVRMENNLKLLCAMGEMTVGRIIAQAVQRMISLNFSENFQASSLSALKGSGESDTAINVEGVGYFGVKEEGEIDFRIPHAGLLQLQRFSRVIYLESPVLWKLKPALEYVRNSPRFPFFTEEERPLVPRYFYDLADALNKRFTDDTDFTDLLDNLAKSIGGKVVLPKSGEMVYQEEGRGAHPLSLTAMGVANLGVLAMLIERKVIGKGAFVFIDEPEAHLHPAWQVEMMETLYALVRKGVHVVIATHSAEIIKWLQVHVDKRQDDKDLFALNHFTRDGVTNGDKGFSEKLTDIQKELTDPYHYLYMKGL